MGQVIMSGIVPKLTVPTVAPPAVTGFTVTGSGMTAALSWTNPSDEGFYQVIVTQKAGSAPTSPTDGEQIYVGTGTSATATGLSADTTYYWAVFAMNDNASYVSGFPTGSYTTPADIYLLNGSDLCTDVTGGWSLTYSFQGYGGMSKTTDGIKIYDTSSEIGGGGVVVTKNKIDLTAYKTLRVTGRSYETFIRFGVYSNRGSTNDTPTPAHASSEEIPGYITRAFDCTLDISNLTGTYYIGLSSIMGAGDWATFYTVELLA